MDFSKVFNALAIAAYWTEDPTNKQPYASDALFPARKKAGLDLKWIRGHKGVGVSLMPSTFDTKATFRAREGFKFTETEMPFFREGFHIGEKDRQMLMSIEQSNDPYAKDIINHIFDDAANLVTGARIVAERMAWQLLAPANGTPGISIKANGVDYTYNYDPDGTWKRSNYNALSTTHKWDAPTTATPIADLIAAKNSILSKTGEMASVVYMNTSTLNKMIACDEVKNRFLTVIKTANAVLTESEAKAVVEAATGLKVRLYDKVYRPEGGGEAAKYLTDGYAVVALDGALGNTWYGTTPEEADLMAGKNNASVAIVNTGVAITTIQQEHPVNTNIFASEIVLPSFERMDAVYCIKAY